MNSEYQKILENEKAYDSFADRQFTDNEGITRDNVKQIILDRCAEARDIINSTNKLINDNLVPVFNDPTILTKEKASELEEFAGLLSSYTNHVDTGISYEVRHALTVYAKHVKDDQMYIRNTFFKGLTLFYLDSALFSEEMLECHLSIISFADRYEEFDKDTRNLIVRSFGNTYVACPKTDFDQFFKYVDNAIDFWDNTASKFDPDFNWQAYHFNVDENICSRCVAALRDGFAFKESHLLRIYYAAKNLAESVDEGKSGLSVSAKSRAKYFYLTILMKMNEISTRRYAEKIYDIYKSAGKGYGFEDVFKKLQLSAIYFHTLARLPHNDMPLNEREETTQEIIKEVFDYIDKIPPDINSPTLPLMITNFSSASGQYYRRYDILKLVLSLTVFRHKPTYVHSVMVAKISLLIADTIIKTCPEHFVGIGGLSSAEEVVEKREDVLSLIWYAGITHDMGKIAYTHMVSLYVRKLLDKEFELIKMHPEKISIFLNQSDEQEKSHVLKDILYDQGEETIEKNFGLVDDKTAFSYFIDIAMGHHKSFDGTFGYPPDFDNTKSVVKKFIDIITVADSLDAATDIVGRSYAKGKSLEEVTVELINGSNTRYCPFVSELVRDDEELKKRITNAIKVYRYDIYYSSFFSKDIRETMKPDLR